MVIGSLRLFAGGVSSLFLSGAACLLASPAGPLLPLPAPASVEARTQPAEEHVEEHVEEQVEEQVEEERPPLLDAWSLAAREDGDACRKELETAGYKFRAYPDKKEPDKSGCGIPHPVLVMRGPTGIAYAPPITVDCSLARALSGVEKIVQEEAALHLHAHISKIGNLGGYACRPRNYRKGASLSAHAFGSAVDFSSFHPAKGTPAIVARDYGEPKRPSKAQEERRRFLRSVFMRLRRHEADLTYTVGPDFNAIHHNHFHLDRGGWHFWFNR